MTARLPIPGADDGTWGIVLNEYLSQSLASDGSIKSGAVGATQINDGAIPQTKVQNLASDLSAKVSSSSIGVAGGVAGLNASGTVPAAQMHPTAASLYPIQEYGFFSATSALENFNSSSTLGSFYLARIFVPAGQAINAVATVVTGAGTLGAGGGNCFCVYSDSGTLIASTPVDDNLWTSTGWKSGTFATPIAAQSNDRFVYASPFCVGYSSAPYIAYCTPSQVAILFNGYNKPVHRRSFYANGLSSPPASFDPATYGGEAAYLPLIALA